jgi:uncharacterized membrane protein YphA (DoxX/SURF4 family)
MLLGLLLLLIVGAGPFSIDRKIENALKALRPDR